MRSLANRHLHSHVRCTLETMRNLHHIQYSVFHIFHFMWLSLICHLPHYRSSYPFNFIISFRWRKSFRCPLSVVRCLVAISYVYHTINHQHNHPSNFRSCTCSEAFIFIFAFNLNWLLTIFLSVGKLIPSNLLTEWLTILNCVFDIEQTIMILHFGEEITKKRNFNSFS